MDPKILSRILESLSSSIKDAIGLSAFTAIGLQQVRREAAIRATPRSLTDQAKKRLRKIPFASQSLFGGKVDAIYKENTETYRGTLVHKAITNQAKSQNSSSQIHKPKSDPKKTAGPKSQPLNNREGKQFSQTPRSARCGHIQRGSGSRGRAGPPLPESSEEVTPLPLPLPHIQVGERLAHFAQNWQKVTNNKWVLSLVKTGYRIPFIE